MISATADDYLAAVDARLDVGISDDAARPIAMLSRTNPAVVTCYAHGLTEGRIGWFVNAAGGAGDVDGQAVRVVEPNADAWTCEAYDASRLRMPAAGLRFVAVAEWAAFAEIVSVSIAETDRTSHDRTRIGMRRKRLRAGAPGAMQVSIDVLHRHLLPRGLELVRDASRHARDLTFALTLRDGTVWAWRGTPVGARLDFRAGDIATGSFDILVAGEVTQPAASQRPTRLTVDDNARNLFALEI